jgi:roadblock/LC7 domain-containing protein
MSELDELLLRGGVLMAGRFGPDWRVAESKSRGLFVEFPPALAVAAPVEAGRPSDPATGQHR